MPIIHIYIYIYIYIYTSGSDVMVKAMDCKIVVSDFVLQSRYYVHFRANTLGKGINPLILPAMGSIVTTTVLLGEWLWH